VLKELKPEVVNSIEKSLGVDSAFKRVSVMEGELYRAHTLRVMVEDFIAHARALSVNIHRKCQTALNLATSVITFCSG
jgi:hypothetical protein